MEICRLTEENYFSADNQLKYFGSSMFKSFMSCEAAALAEIKGDYVREKSTALIVGGFIDSYFSGTLDPFKANNPEIFKRDGTLKSEYIQAEEIINRIERDKMFMEFMGGQKQVIMTGEIEGIPFKIKIDSYHPDRMIVDGKVMKDFQSIYVPEKGRLNWVEAWQYDLQGAAYQEIVQQNTRKQLPFYLAAATKEKVTDLDIVQIPQPYLDVELDNIKSNIIRYDAIKQGLIEPTRCEHCDWCKMTKVLTKITTLEELDNE